MFWRSLKLRSLSAREVSNLLLTSWSIAAARRSASQGAKRVGTWQDKSFEASGASCFTAGRPEAPLRLFKCCSQVP